jgi:hypothetical protein
MGGIKASKIGCPYCGEQVELLIDCSVGHQEYIEDCQVCCRPITIVASIDEDGLATVTARDENA